MNLQDEYEKMLKLKESKFVPKVYATFENDKETYMVMELCNEDIDSYINAYYEASLCTMNEKQAQNYKNSLKFIIASIVQGLEDIHE